MSYYEILQVSPTASDEVIRASYKAMSKKYHPDIYPDGEDMMKAINKAYEVLCDPVRRQEYDKTLLNHSADSQSEQCTANKDRSGSSDNEKEDKDAFSRLPLAGKVFAVIAYILFHILYFAWGVFILLVIIGFFTGHSQVLFGKLFDWFLGLFDNLL